VRFLKLSGILEKDTPEEKLSSLLNIKEKPSQALRLTDGDGIFRAGGRRPTSKKSFLSSNTGLRTKEIGILKVLRASAPQAFCEDPPRNQARLRATMRT
jgi:hypothetical protein